HRSELQGGQPVTQAEGWPAQQTADEMQRRWQRRGLQTRRDTTPGDDLDLQPGVEAHLVFRAKRPPELESRAIAAGECVLPVVDELTGRGVLKRGGAPPEPAALFDHDNSRAARRQAHGRAEAGEAGADDDDIRPGHRDRAACEATLPAQSTPA